MSETQTTPPNGDPKQAEKYINQLVALMDQDKITVTNTDLSQFDPGLLQDHYRTELSDYQVEVSHTKNPDNGADSYVILFNNLKQLKEGSAQKTILAFIHLDQSQFHRFKAAARSQISRKQKAQQEKRLQDALSPIDRALEEIASTNQVEEDNATDLKSEN